MALHGAGFHVAACASGAAARQALKTCAYALAIIDSVLPDGSVQELLREIRFQERDTRLPIILLAPGSETLERGRAAKLSVDEIVPKPCDMVQLLRIANKLTQTGRQKPHDTAGGANVCRKLMIAHSDPSVRRAFVEAFRSDGVTVLVATSLDDSFSLLASERVDAIIVDFLLPPSGCLELCRAIRKNAMHKPIPLFVMVSPGDDPDAFRKAKAAGADELIVKTSDIGVVRTHVREVLGRIRRDRGTLDHAIGAGAEAESARPPSSRDPNEDSGPRLSPRTPRTVPPPRPSDLGQNATRPVRAPDVPKPEYEPPPNGDSGHFPHPEKRPSRAPPWPRTHLEQTLSPNFGLPPPGGNRSTAKKRP